MVGVYVGTFEVILYLDIVKHTVVHPQKGNEHLALQKYLIACLPDWTCVEWVQNVANREYYVTSSGEEN